MYFNGIFWNKCALIASNGIFYQLSQTVPAQLIDENLTPLSKQIFMDGIVESRSRFVGSKEKAVCVAKVDETPFLSYTKKWNWNLSTKKGFLAFVKDQSIKKSLGLNEN